MKKRIIILSGAIAALSLSPISTQTAEAKPKVSVKADVGIRIPNGAVRVSVGKKNYYHHKGTYYQKNKNNYRVVKPPHGATIRQLPRGYSRIVISGNLFYRFNDIYYRHGANGYVVVSPPVVIEKETQTDNPIDEYETVWIDQEKFLYKNGQFFRESPDGLIWIEAPIGATVKGLPQDATSIWYNNIEYYESDEIIYRKTPEGYKIVEAPWNVKDLGESEEKDTHFE